MPSALVITRHIISMCAHLTWGPGFQPQLTAPSSKLKKATGSTRRKPPHADRRIGGGSTAQAGTRPLSAAHRLLSRAVEWVLDGLGASRRAQKPQRKGAYETPFPSLPTPGSKIVTNAAGKARFTFPECQGKQQCRVHGLYPPY